MDAAPILKDWEYMLMVLGDTFFCHLRNELDIKYAPSRIRRQSLHACVVHAATCTCKHVDLYRW